MCIKRMIAVLIAVIVLAALFAITAYAESWWENASEDVAVYPTAPEPTAGDVNRDGIVEAADARQALRFSVGLDQDLLRECNSADYNGDGKTTAADARKILRCAVGLEGTALLPPDDGAYRIRVSSWYYQYSSLGALIDLEVNADRVTGKSGGTLPLWRLRSAADVEAFRKTYGSVKLDAYGGIGSYGETPVEALLRRYNEAFFADRELFICYIVEGSGSKLQAVFPPAVTKDGALTFSVKSVSPRGITDDIGNWFLFLPVEKSLVKDCVSFDCRRLPGEILPYMEIRAAEKGETKWTYAYAHLLSGGAEFGLQPYGEAVFALENTREDAHWEYETEAVVRAYQPEWFGSDEVSCDLWLKEESLGRPSASDGPERMQFYTVTSENPGTYTLRFLLKRDGEAEPLEERTVKLVFSEAQVSNYDGSGMTEG